MPSCSVIRHADAFHGKQGLDYTAGVSAETAGAQALCLHRLSMPPGARAHAHLHRDHESAIFLVSGSCEFWWGARLEHHERVAAGDIVYIPAGVPHLPYNGGDEVAEAVIARTDPREQESVELLPDLDALPHLPPRQS